MGWESSGFRTGIGFGFGFGFGFGLGFGFGFGVGTGAGATLLTFLTSDGVSITVTAGFPIVFNEKVGIVGIRAESADVIILARPVAAFAPEQVANTATPQTIFSNKFNIFMIFPPNSYANIISYRCP